MSDFLKKMKENLDTGKKLSDLDEVKKMNDIHTMVETDQYKKGEVEKNNEKIERLTEDEVLTMDSIEEFDVEISNEEEKLKLFASIMNCKLAYLQTKQALKDHENAFNVEKDKFIGEFGEEEFNKLRDLNI